MSSRRRSARIAGLVSENATPKKVVLPLKKQILKEEEQTGRVTPIIPPLLRRPSASEKDPVKVQQLSPGKTSDNHPEKCQMSPQDSENKDSINSIEEVNDQISNEEKKINKATVIFCADIENKPEKNITEPDAKKIERENQPPAIKGRCKSGRFWKSERDRFRSVIKSKGLKLNLKQRMKHKEDRLRVKAYEQSLKDRVKKEKEDLRARQEENKKNREENQRKSEVVQQVQIQSPGHFNYIFVCNLFFIAD